MAIRSADDYIDAVAETYCLAQEDSDLGTAPSRLSGSRVNRFLHVTESVEDVVSQNRMQRRLGQRTGTCFRRCVGMDAINALYSVTYDMDRRAGSGHSSPLARGSARRAKAPNSAAISVTTARAAGLTPTMLAKPWTNPSWRRSDTGTRAAVSFRA